MAKKTKRLNEVNQHVLFTALTDLQNSNIVAFHTQSLFYVFIENIKFPHLIEQRKWKGWIKNMDRKPFYAQTNYMPVINWMLDRGVITVVPTIRGKKQTVYRYEVNREKLANIADVTPFYTV